MQQLIKKVRIQLEENPYAQIGVSAIKWECTKLGITPPPDRTINRILKRADLLKKTSYQPIIIDNRFYPKADQLHSVIYNC